MNWLNNWYALGVVTVLYCVQAGAYIAQGRPAMCLVFVGYALANVGLIWDFMRHSQP
jgi:hypothetical protein